MKDLKKLDRYRYDKKQPEFIKDNSRRSLIGIFEIPLNKKETVSVIADNGISFPEWEHLSVSTSKRFLTNEEIHFIKDIFFNDDEIVIQIYSKNNIVKSKKNYCIHLWKLKTEDIPLPPMYML